MQSAAFFSRLGGLVLLIVVCGVRCSAGDMCKCSNITCTTRAGDECCLWDFPVVDLNPNFGLEGHPHGFVLSSLLVDGSDDPSVCVTYPISDEHVDSKNYFLISLESDGPEMCIYEPGKMENMKCSNDQVHYCSGESVSGVSSARFSFYCKNCQLTETFFYFRVYSDQYNTTNENWCDDVPKPVPSDLLQSTVATPEAEIVEDDSGSGDSVTLLPTPTVSPEPSITHSEPSEGDANGAQSLALPAVFWTFLSAVILIL